MNDQDCYTPDEAKGRLCAASFAQSPSSGINTFNCAADSCMAWRWSQSDKTKAFSKRVIEIAKEREIDWGKAWQWCLKHEADKFARTHGYCGLAGYPHNSLRP